MEGIEPGLTAQVERLVTEEDTAERRGSGGVPVFGTPSLVGLMEHAAVKALDGHLAAYQTSVGSRIDVHHSAPTPVGMRVRARATLNEKQGQRVEFEIEAWDEVESIGKASHTRFIVERSPFVQKARSKGERRASSVPPGTLPQSSPRGT